MASHTLGSEERQVLQEAEKALVSALDEAERKRRVEHMNAWAKLYGKEPLTITVGVARSALIVIRASLAEGDHHSNAVLAERKAVLDEINGYRDEVGARNGLYDTAIDNGLAEVYRRISSRPAPTPTNPPEVEVDGCRNGPNPNWPGPDGHGG